MKRSFRRPQARVRYVRVHACSYQRLTMHRSCQCTTLWSQKYFCYFLDSWHSPSAAFSDFRYSRPMSDQSRTVGRHSRPVGRYFHFPDKVDREARRFVDDDGDYDDNRTRATISRNADEGVNIACFLAEVSVVRDHFISTVCSRCLNKNKFPSAIRLQRCSKCKFLNYCSKQCQVRNLICWIVCCGLLIAVRAVGLCPRHRHALGDCAKGNRYFLTVCRASRSELPVFYEI